MIPSWWLVLPMWMALQSYSSLWMPLFSKAGIRSLSSTKRLLTVRDYKTQIGTRNIEDTRRLNWTPPSTMRRTTERVVADLATKVSHYPDKVVSQLCDIVHSSTVRSSTQQHSHFRLWKRRLKKTTWLSRRLIKATPSLFWTDRTTTLKWWSVWIRLEPPGTQIFALPPTTRHSEAWLTEVRTSLLKNLLGRPS